MATARWFDEAKHDGSVPFGGVPLRDLDDDDWAALPKHVQESTDALPYFRKTNPNPTPRGGKHEETVSDG